MKLSKHKIEVLDAFEERQDEWHFGDFESALTKKLGTGSSYQDAKETIIKAYELGKWPKTVKRYVLTNLKTFQNCPSELNPICNVILASMSDAEKLAWK